MALFNSYKPPAASGVLGSTWRTEDGGYQQRGGLAYFTRFKAYTNTAYSTLGTSINHYDAVGYSEYWNDESDGYSRRTVDADIPRLDRKYRGVRAHLTNAEHKHINTQHGGESLYFASKKISGYSKVLSSGPVYQSEVWPPHLYGVYKRNVYEKKDGSWQVKASDRAVSLFRMVYTDDQGDGDEKNENVFLAFGKNSTHGITTSQSPVTGRITNPNSHVPGGGTLNPLSNNHNTYVSNAGISIIFREYVHYVGNDLGGTGLIDLTPFSITATAFVERNMKTDIYSPYGNPELVDFGNQVSPIKLWPKTHLTGLTNS